MSTTDRVTGSHGECRLVAKMLADCEVLYIPVFLAWANMGEGFLL